MGVVRYAAISISWSPDGEGFFSNYESLKVTSGYATVIYFKYSI